MVVESRLGSQRSRVRRSSGSVGVVVYFRCFFRWVGKKQEKKEGGEQIKTRPNRPQFGATNPFTKLPCLQSFGSSTSHCRQFVIRTANKQSEKSNLSSNRIPIPNFASFFILNSATNRLTLSLTFVELRVKVDRKLFLAVFC